MGRSGGRAWRSLRKGATRQHGTSGGLEAREQGDAERERGLSGRKGYHLEGEREGRSEGAAGEEKGKHEGHGREGDEEDENE